VPNIRRFRREREPLPAGEPGVGVGETAANASATVKTYVSGKSLDTGIDIRLSGVCKDYTLRSERIQVLQGVDITVKPGEFVSILGPSGCGKSTLLHVIAGLEAATAGDIAIDGAPTVKRTVYFGYMFQKDLLLPWLNVRDNVALGLEISTRSQRSAGREQALELLSRYDLESFARAYPSQLSGGMRQRAALMRTLLIDRRGILLDEPFGALDALTRRTMQDWLLKVLENTSKTVIFVTHDIDEAILLSDRVLVMTPRPSRVHSEWPINLSRPRSKEITLTSEFGEYRRQLYDVLL
jgi:ABC-type nitrate/sulfonate/bicarbonate transport system ATPase subunit